MGGRCAQKPGQTLSKVLVRDEERPGVCRGSVIREGEFGGAVGKKDKASCRGGDEGRDARRRGTAVEQKRKKLCVHAKSTPIKVRAGRVLAVGSASLLGLGPARSAPRASAPPPPPHAPLLAPGARARTTPPAA